MPNDRVTVGIMRQIASQFELSGKVADARHYGSGHINDTYLVRMQADPERRCIFQRINRRVFRNVVQLMDNIARVTAHIRHKLEECPGHHSDREALTLIPTRTGASFLETENGDCWRAYVFIDGARTFDTLENHRQAREAGKAFGLFQKMLADLPSPPLHETIPDFHHTPKRYAALLKAISENPHRRLESCKAEIDFAMSLEPMIGRVTQALDNGELPWRVTHNDTKINNVMLDDVTSAGVCVIDLDTVMPGSVLYDFGDQIRTSVGHFREGERDLAKVYVDLERFESLTRGYLDVARDFLTPREVDWLVFSGLLITYEIGIRFLTDYLQGDVYFKISSPHENLDRARTQLALARSIQANESAMQGIVERYRRAGPGVAP